MNYSEKLKDPRWQKKRLEIMQRDDFTCQLCGDKEDSLQVHHQMYLAGKEPWEYDDENFITYCHLCHRIVGDFKGYRVLEIDKLKLIDGCLLTAIYIIQENITIQDEKWRYRFAFAFAFYHYSQESKSLDTTSVVNASIVKLMEHLLQKHKDA